MRMSLVNKWLIIAVVTLLQLLLAVSAQIEPVISAITTTSAVSTLSPTTSKAPVVVSPVTTTTPQATTITTTVVPVPTTTTVIPTTTTVSTLSPSSIVASTTIVVPSSVSTTTTTTTTTSSTSISSSPTNRPSSTASSSTTASSSAAPSASSGSSSPNQHDKESNTPIIVGCVVGGVVGIALIGGILACVNRRGGCTKRSDKNKSDFEDYGLGDFPHQRTPAVAPPMVSNTKPVSPTIPRMNEQGNYYNEDPNYGHYGYQDNNMDYGMQPQQGYYYPQQQQQQQQEYYDDGGYYYDSNTSGTAYSSAPPPMHQQQPQQGYAMANVPQHLNTAPQDVYKPDEVGSPINSNANMAHHHNR